jgi:hypothetical protein
MQETHTVSRQGTVYNIEALHEGRHMKTGERQEVMARDIEELHEGKHMETNMLDA